MGFASSVNDFRHRHEIWRFLNLISSSSSGVIANAVFATVVIIVDIGVFDAVPEAASDHLSAGIFLSAPTQAVGDILLDLTRYEIGAEVVDGCVEGDEGSVADAVLRPRVDPIRLKLGNCDSSLKSLITSKELPEFRLPLPPFHSSLPSFTLSVFFLPPSFDLLSSIPLFSSSSLFSVFCVALELAKSLRSLIEIIGSGSVCVTANFFFPF